MVRTVVFAEMLGDFEHQAVIAVLGLERVQDRRQMAVELHVDHGAVTWVCATDLVVGSVCDPSPSVFLLSVPV
jgi:hypothetical protein